MHGLESGLQGRKSQYLHKHFTNVNTPDMQMSLFNITKKNSVVRNILKTLLFQNLALLFCTSIAICYYTWYGLLFLSLCCLGLGVLRNKMIQQGLQMSLQQCIDVQSKALQKFQPCLVVGSSWGGLVALHCIVNGAYNCPMILIAPPVKMVLNKINAEGWRKIRDQLKKNTTTIYVVHGELDKTVPLNDSQELVANTNIHLQVIANGDHSLNSTLLEDDNAYCLKSIIEKQLQT